MDEHDPPTTDALADQQRAATGDVSDPVVAQVPCEECGGTGSVAGGAACASCAGTGTVSAPVGGG